MRNHIIHILYEIVGNLISINKLKYIWLDMEVTPTASLRTYFVTRLILHTTMVWIFCFNTWFYVLFTFVNAHCALIHWHGWRRMASNISILVQQRGWCLSSQAITWTSDDSLSITHFEETCFGNQNVSIQKVHLETSAGRWRSFYPGLNM